MGKLFTSHVSDKRLISRRYEELIQLNSQKIKNKTKKQKQNNPVLK